MANASDCMTSAVQAPEVKSFAELKFAPHW